MGLLWSRWHLKGTRSETLVVLTSAKDKWAQRADVQEKEKKAEKYGKDTTEIIQRFLDVKMP